MLNRAFAHTLALLLAVSHSAFAQTAVEPLTLPLAVEIALKTNPLTRATEAGRAMADAQVSEAKAARFPLLQVSENFAASNNPVFVFGSLLEQARFAQKNFDLRALNNPATMSNFRSSVNFKLPLFDQRQTATRINRAQFGQQQADAQTNLVAQQIRFETLKAFYGVLLAQAHQEVADEAVKLAAADVKRSRDRVETGLAVVSDLLAAEVQLAEATQQQIQAAGEIVIARAALNTALGLPINAPQTINGALLEKDFDLAEQDELLRLALAHRSDLSRAQLQVRSNQEQMRGTRSEWLPRLDVFTSAGVSSQAFNNGSADYLVGASVTFNLFDAGRKARLQQARAGEALVVAEQQHLTNQIRFEVVRAQQQFISARARLNVAGRAVTQATEALRIVQDRYLEGLTTITELLRAETALTQTRMSLVAARYEHYVGYAQVLLSCGRLNDVQVFVS